MNKWKHKLLKEQPADYIHDPRECDCGRPKFPGNEACKRCTDLDGRDVCEASIIAAMRSAGGWVSARELADHIGRHYGTTYRIMDDLVERGRMVRQQRELDGNGHLTGRQWGRAGCGWCWEYSLAQKRRVA
jgi:hypothetical protein